MTHVVLRNLLVCAVLTAVVAGCARRESDDSEDGNATSVEPAAAPATPAAPAPGPAPELAAVRIEVSLSPDAEQTLKSAGETVSVEVIYGGDPAPGSTITPNDFGLVELSKSVHELPGAGTVDIAEDDIDKSRLDQIVGQPQIMVNVVSGKKTTQQNLLACEFYWDTLSAAGRNGVRIACTPIQPAS